jgi:DNA-binding FadR family transcriptional regulator
LLLRDLHTLLRLGRVSVAHLLEARLLVEPDVARLAAMRASDADLKSLRQAMDARTEAGSSGTPWRLLDLGFHRLVAEAAKNPVHTLLTHALMDLEADLTVPRIELTDMDSREIDGAHRDIYEAVASRDAGRARATMEAHVVDVQRRLHRAEMQETARSAASITAVRGTG